MTVILRFHPSACSVRFPTFRARTLHRVRGWVASVCEPGKVRAMMRFRCEVRVACDGNEADGKSVLDLLALAPPDGSTVRVRLRDQMPPTQYARSSD